MKVFMELCPALQGGEKVPDTPTGLWEIILCNYLVTGNILSGLVYEASLPSDFNLYKGTLICGAW